jgi:hypothetical protein
LAGHESLIVADELANKMRCLMRAQSAFDWLGTWNTNEYIDFYTEQQYTFQSSYSSNSTVCRSMFKDYLDAHFHDNDGIALRSINYVYTSNKTRRRTSTSIVERCHTRQLIWNNQIKYLTKPNLTDVIGIYQAKLLPDTHVYVNVHNLLSRNLTTDPRRFIHLNIYPLPNNEHVSKQSVSTNRTSSLIDDPICAQVMRELFSEANKRRPTSVDRTRKQRLFR